MSWLVGQASDAGLVAASTRTPLGERPLAQLREQVVLVADGQVRSRRGVFDLADVRYVLYETKGSITVVPRDGGTDEPLVRAGVEAAAGYP